VNEVEKDCIGVIVLGIFNATIACTDIHEEFCQESVDGIPIWVSTFDNHGIRLESKIKFPVANKMTAAIDDVRTKGDSIGGVVTCIVRYVLRGLGAPVFDKLEAELAKALMSLPATKRFGIGSGFAGTLITGSKHIMINSHPDTDDAAAYENPDEEAVAMIEKSPTTVAMLSRPAADDCGHGSSFWSMDCSTIMKVRTTHISSAILAARPNTEARLF
jgi:hypothetical protein